jgi:hypothetical protein
MEEIEEMEEVILTPKHKELLRRLQALFPEAHLEEEENINLLNRGGWRYAHGPGISLTRVTRSYESGPEMDFFPEIKQILCNSGFKMERYDTTGYDDYHFEDYETYYFLESCNLEYDY